MHYVKNCARAEHPAIGKVCVRLLATLENLVGQVLLGKCLNSQEHCIEWTERARCCYTYLASTVICEVVMLEQRCRDDEQSVTGDSVES